MTEEGSGKILSLLKTPQRLPYWDASILSFFLEVGIQTLEDDTVLRIVGNKQLHKRLVENTKIVACLNKIVPSWHKSSAICLDSKNTKFLKKLNTFVSIHSLTVKMVCLMQTNREKCGVKEPNQCPVWMTTPC